jgi:hypothetical protein
LIDPEILKSEDIYKITLHVTKIPIVHPLASPIYETSPPYMQIKIILYKTQFVHVSISFLYETWILDLSD